MSGGWVAIALGALLGPHFLHVIDGEVLLNVRPLIMIGLGWIGFIVGMQGRSELLMRVPGVLWKWTFSDAVLSIVLTGAIAVVAMRRAVRDPLESIARIADALEGGGPDEPEARAAWLRRCSQWLRLCVERARKTEEEVQRA